MKIKPFSLLLHRSLINWMPEWLNPRSVNPSWGSRSSCSFDAVSSWVRRLRHHCFQPAGLRGSCEQRQAVPLPASVLGGGDRVDKGRLRTPISARQPSTGAAKRCCSLWLRLLNRTCTVTEEASWPSVARNFFFFLNWPPYLGSWDDQWELLSRSFWAAITLTLSSTGFPSSGSASFLPRLPAKASTASSGTVPFWKHSSGYTK